MKLRLPNGGWAISFAVMKKVRNPRSSFVVPALGLLWLAGIAGLRAEQVADFSIVDVNTASPRYDTAVSPRDYLHQVAGYYFGDPN
ncbi:MAG: hypothetical protein GY953_42940 [bacterium]|nr:hypothetical protein [bacterium]